MPTKQPTPDQVMSALLHDVHELDPLDNLIATSEAVFNLIRISEMDILAKNAFYQLEKQFGFYARLVRTVNSE